MASRHTPFRNPDHAGEVGDGEGDVPYRANMPYDLVKAAVVRMGEGLAHELKPHGVTALTVTPGWLRSESMLDYFSVTEDTWRDRATRSRTSSTPETSHLLARGVAALAADPTGDRFAGQCLGSWELMRECGLEDTDGTQPDLGRRRPRSPPVDPDQRHARPHVMPRPRTISNEAILAVEGVATPELMANAVAMLQLDLADPDFHSETLRGARAVRTHIERDLSAALDAGELRAGTPT